MHGYGSISLGAEVWDAMFRASIRLSIHLFLGTPYSHRLSSCGRGAIALTPRMKLVFCSSHRRSFWPIVLDDQRQQVTLVVEI